MNQEFLKQCLFYNKDNGEFVWRYRHSTPENINATNAYKPAGFIKLGYRQIGLNGKVYMAHRLAWIFYYGVNPDDMIDHINGNRLDNRIENLRLCTPQQNQWNRSKSVKNTSGFKGVSYEKKNKKWRARIKIDGGNKCLGLYQTKQEAADAYNSYAKKIHGEFYRSA